MTREHARQVGTRACKHTRHICTRAYKHARHVGMWAHEACNLPDLTCMRANFFGKILFALKIVKMGQIGPKIGLFEFNEKFGI